MIGFKHSHNKRIKESLFDAVYVISRQKQYSLLLIAFYRKVGKDKKNGGSIIREIILTFFLNRTRQAKHYN